MVEEAKHQQIGKIVATIDSGAPIEEGERTRILDILENYECWAPFFRLIDRSIKDPQNQNISDYVRLARVQNLYLEDVFEAAETCSQAVKSLDLSFDVFMEKVIPQVIEAEDWTAEATILQAVADKFVAIKDQVAAMERLCLLFEKKTFNESQLNESSTKLLELDPLNIKALRYFKVVFTQHYEWEKVVSVLHSLLEASRHPQDVYRVAQELAAVYLYQLDQPRQAIEVIDNYCEGSPLDASTINFDAYQRLGDWKGCLNVLRECLLSLEDDQSRAVLHFKMAQLEERLNRGDNAARDYEKAVALWPKFLEPYENLIYLAIQSRDWQTVKSWMVKLSDQVEDDGLKLQISEAYTRLDKGVEDAKQG